MKRRGMLVLALVASVMALRLDRRGGLVGGRRRHRRSAARARSRSRSSTPLTGGAGFLGNEQLSWAKYAVKTLAPKYGLKITARHG